MSLLTNFRITLGETITNKRKGDKMRKSGASRLIREILDEKPFNYYAIEGSGFVRTASVEKAMEVEELKSSKIDKLYRKNMPAGKSTYRVHYYAGGEYKLWAMSNVFPTFAKAMDFYAGQAYSSMKAWEEG